MPLRENAAPLFAEPEAAAAWTAHDAAEQSRLSAMHDLLLQAYGQPAPREVWDPLTQLIYSLCSSRTKTSS